jgi:NAD(P)-dependent dehydrogenase (short-subunit alcohol dehydrogenase family)
MGGDARAVHSGVRIGRRLRAEIRAGCSWIGHGAKLAGRRGDRKTPLRYTAPMPPASPPPSRSSHRQAHPHVSRAVGVALVTGGARRIGREIAIALARAGWDIAVHYASSRADAYVTAGEIEGLGRRALPINRDIAIEAGVRSMLAECESDLGPVRCIVNNASRFEFDDAASFRVDPLLDLIRVNTAAPILLAQALHASVTARNTNGVVINLLDQKLGNPNPDFLSYTLSKAALAEATVLLAQALAPRVRVIGIAPGITLPATGQSQTGFERAHAAMPLGYGSTPTDIAEAVVYAVQARAVTGTVLTVDGGQHLMPSARDVMFTTEPKP